jgi:hypothetical protein
VLSWRYKRGPGAVVAQHLHSATRASIKSHTRRGLQNLPLATSLALCHRHIDWFGWREARAAILGHLSRAFADLGLCPADGACWAPFLRACTQLVRACAAHGTAVWRQKNWGRSITANRYQDHTSDNVRLLKNAMGELEKDDRWLLEAMYEPQIPAAREAYISAHVDSLGE